MRKTRPLIALVASGLVALLALAGCYPLLDLVVPDETSAPTGESVPEELRPYYEQTLTWRDCANGAQCAMAIAPLDWADPASGTDIELALVRHKATDGRPQGSLFFNPGGPGVSGVDFVRDAPEQVVSRSVRREFDLVGWDPRGVGSSSAVTCFTDSRDMDRLLYGVPDGEPGSPEWRAEVNQAGEDFANACARNTGELLGHIDTVSTVRDLDMLRAVLGDEKLNYFGMSYGTQIGAEYADLFPGKVGRMVLDGVTDPAAGLFEVVLNQTVGFDRALRNYLKACPEAGCPFSGDPDRDIRTIADLYDKLDADPIAAADGRLLDSAAMDVAVKSALYEEQLWPYLTQAFLEVYAGDPVTAFALADFYYGRDQNGEYPGNFFESFFAITCLDYPVETDPAELERETAMLNEITPLASDVAMADPVCGNWRYPPTGAPAPVRGEGAAPILLIGTSGDPATPYEWAVSLSEQLESAVLLSFDGDDHIAYDEGDPCINELVDSYFIAGVVPERDPRCGF